LEVTFSVFILTIHEKLVNLVYGSISSKDVFSFIEFNFGVEEDDKVDGTKKDNPDRKANEDKKDNADMKVDGEEDKDVEANKDKKDNAKKYG